MGGRASFPFLAWDCEPLKKSVTDCYLTYSNSLINCIAASLVTPGNKLLYDVVLLAGDWLVACSDSTVFSPENGAGALHTRTWTAFHFTA
jgi:hypothetical protein